MMLELLQFMNSIKKGRPAITDKTKERIVQKLEPYLKVGLSIKKACIQAQIPKSTVYKLIQRDSDFADQIKRHEQYLSTLFSSSVTFQLHSVVAKQLMGKQIDQLDFNFMKWFASASKQARDEFGVNEQEDLKRQWSNLADVN